MTLRELITKIEEKYPLSLASDWDNVGLMVGDLDRPITKVLTALEVNEAIVQEAIEQKVDLILTHHPFLFKKLSRIHTDDLKGKLIYQLISNQIGVYSMHTNYDIAFGGLNDAFMDRLGITDSQILDPVNTEDAYRNANGGRTAGLGRIGTLAAPISLEDLCGQLKTTLNMKHIRVCGNLSDMVQTVAVITGAAAEMFPIAKKAGADVYISGDMKYHEAQDARDCNMNVIDCGHFETEDIFSDSIHPFLTSIGGFEVIKSHTNLNPFQIV